MSMYPSIPVPIVTLIKCELTRDTTTSEEESGMGEPNRGRWEGGFVSVDGISMVSGWLALF